MQQGCLTCSTPTNHVRDLSDALDDVTPAATVAKANANASTIVLANANASTNRPTTKPQPPPDHLIVRLTEMFQDAIQDNDIFELESAMKQYTLAMSSNPDFATYNRSDLRTAHNQAKQILNSNSTTMARHHGSAYTSAFHHFLFPASSPTFCQF